MALFEIVPAIDKVVGHDAGDLAHFERDARDLFDLFLLCRLLEGFGQMEDDAHLVHGLLREMLRGSLLAEQDLAGALDRVFRHLRQLILTADHVGRIGKIAA